MARRRLLLDKFELTIAMVMVELSGIKIAARRGLITPARAAAAAPML